MEVLGNRRGRGGFQRGRGGFRRGRGGFQPDRDGSQPAQPGPDGSQPGRGGFQGGRGGMGRGRGGLHQGSGNNMNGQQNQHGPTVTTLAVAPASCRATQIRPDPDAAAAAQDCNFIAIDIEFQNFRHVDDTKWSHRIGRIALVNERDETLLDTYAAYPNIDGVKKRVPPEKFLVTWKDLKYVNGAQRAVDVETWVANLIRGKTVILWGGTHDRACLPAHVWAGAERILDIQYTYTVEMNWVSPHVGLAKATARFLGDTIQGTSHSPVEDAVATMRLAMRLDDQGRLDNLLVRNTEPDPDGSEYMYPDY